MEKYIARYWVCLFMPDGSTYHYKPEYYFKANNFKEAIKIADKHTTNFKEYTNSNSVLESLSKSE